MGVNLILVSVTRWMRLTFLLSGVFVLILGTANYFVDAFRGYGIVYMDIYAVRTAANVAGEYKYHGSPQLWLGLSLGLLCLVLCVVATPARRESAAFGKGLPVSWERLSAWFFSCGSIWERVFLMMSAI